MDDLDFLLDEEAENPEFEAAFVDAALRSSLLKRLVSRRKARGLSQSTVAERMETTQSAVSELEAAGTDPRLSTLQRYARAIGCRVDVRLLDDGGEWRFGNAYSTALSGRPPSRASGNWVAVEENEGAFSEPVVWATATYSLRQESTEKG
ncbi:helix-turn-helix transcriptional regulator [Streptomyces coelicolor]|nr:helix-turn-helix transcriptional regulator [Streptomyces coelicolor]